MGYVCSDTFISQMLFFLPNSEPKANVASIGSTVVKNYMYSLFKLLWYHRYMTLKAFFLVKYNVNFDNFTKYLYNCFMEFPIETLR